MTVLYSNDFEAGTVGNAVAGWTNVTGAFTCVSSGAGYNTVSGTKAFSCGSTDGNIALYTGIAARADMALSGKFKYAGDGSGHCHFGPVIRSNIGASDGYRFYMLGNGAGNIQLLVRSRVGGSETAIGGTPTANLLTGVSVGTTVNWEARCVGTAIEFRIWTSGGRPSSPSWSTTDSSVTAAGYAGVRLVVNGQASASYAVDDVVIDDTLVVAATLSGSVTLDDLVAGGTLSVTPSSLTGSIALDDLVASGALGQAPGTITVPGLRNAATALVSNSNIANVLVIRISDRAILASLANQATNGSGDLVLSGVAFAPGTPVMVLGFDATGANSFRRAVVVV